MDTIQSHTGTSTAQSAKMKSFVAILTAILAVAASAIVVPANSGSVSVTLESASAPSAACQETYVFSSSSAVLRFTSCTTTTGTKIASKVIDLSANSTSDVVSLTPSMIVGASAMSL